MEPLPGTPPAPGTAPGVASNGQPGPAAAPAAAPGAKETASRFGGLPGGRKREDGLVPGSPQAIAADRERDRLRKKDERKAKPKQPAPLPSANVSDQVKAPAGPLGPVPVPEAVPFLPWQPEALKPLFDQLLPAAEELTVHQITERAAKARLPGDVVHEIEASAKWPGLAKKGLEISAPQVTAKWLNKAGISSEYQPEITFGTALSIILANHVKLLKRLDKLIALANVQTKPKEERKP